MEHTYVIFCIIFNPFTATTATTTTVAKPMERIKVETKATEIRTIRVPTKATELRAEVTRAAVMAATVREIPRTLATVATRATGARASKVVARATEPRAAVMVKITSRDMVATPKIRVKAMGMASRAALRRAVIRVTVGC